MSYFYLHCFVIEWLFLDKLGYFYLILNLIFIPGFDVHYFQGVLGNWLQFM